MAVDRGTSCGVWVWVFFVWVVVGNGAPEGGESATRRQSWLAP